MDINSIIEMINNTVRPSSKVQHVDYELGYGDACDDIIEQLRKMSDGSTIETKWVSIDEVTKILSLAKENKWFWFKNTRCKYLNLRVDMRDGHCIIKDRDGNKITIDQLNYQHG